MFLLPDFLHLVSFGSGTGRTQLSSPLCLIFCLATPLFTSIAMADVPIDHLNREQLVALMYRVASKLALPEGQHCSSSCFPGRQHWLRPAPSVVPWCEPQYDVWNADLYEERKKGVEATVHSPVQSWPSPTTPDTPSTGATTDEDSPKWATELPSQKYMKGSAAGYTGLPPTQWSPGPRGGMYSTNFIQPDTLGVAATLESNESTLFQDCLWKCN